MAAPFPAALPENMRQTVGIERMEAGAAVLLDGHRVDVDVLMFCTGQSRLERRTTLLPALLTYRAPNSLSTTGLLSSADRLPVYVAILISTILCFW